MSNVSNSTRTTTVTYSQIETSYNSVRAGLERQLLQPGLSASQTAAISAALQRLDREFSAMEGAKGGAKTAIAGDLVDHLWQADALIDNVQAARNSCSTASSNTPANAYWNNSAITAQNRTYESVRLGLESVIARSDLPIAVKNSLRDTLARLTSTFNDMTANRNSDAAARRDFGSQLADSIRMMHQVCDGNLEWTVPAGCSSRNASTQTSGSSQTPGSAGSSASDTTGSPINCGNAATSQSGRSEGQSSVTSQTAASGSSAQSTTNGKVDPQKLMHDGRGLMDLQTTNPEEFAKMWKSLKPEQQQVAMMNMQKEAQNQQMLMTMLTNTLKAQHDTVMAVARNLAV